MKTPSFGAMKTPLQYIDKRVGGVFGLAYVDFQILTEYKIYSIFMDD
jgi:hypothetical protein